MKKYILLYQGPATDMSDMSDSEAKDIKESWQEWMEDIGDALVDIGAPLGEGISVVDDGAERDALQLSGYSIIQAQNLDEAHSICEMHPFLSEDEGEYSIELFELGETPF